MSHSVDVFESRAHLMQQVNDLTRNGYRNWCTGTVPLIKAQAWAKKAEVLYRISADQNARARGKKEGRGSAHLLMYRLDRSLATNRLGWILLVTDGIHAAHSGEQLHRAEDNPVELFGYQLIREPRPNKSKPVWTWKMKRSHYDMWREHIIDVVRRGSDFDIRKMLKDLSSAPGFSAIRAQQKALHKLVNAEWARRHKKGARRGYTLPHIWKARRMRVVRVDLATYLSALADARREAAAETGESLALAPQLEPEAVYPVVAPPDALEEAQDDEDAAVDAQDSTESQRGQPRIKLRWKKPRGARGTHADVRDDTAQPVRQRGLPLPLPPAAAPASPSAPPAGDESVPPWCDSSSSPASDSAPDADGAADAA